MEWILQHKAWLLTILGAALFLTLMPVFSRLTVFVARMRQRFSRTSPAPRPPADPRLFPSGNMGATGDAPELATSELATSELAAPAPPSGYQETPTPSTIVAEVCSLNSPVRERVEQSFRGLQVRWTLRLTEISEREQAGSLHAVRMCPNARSALACAVYFGVNLEAHPVLQTAHKDELFVVEGTIESVEDMDIDLKDVRTIARVA